MPQRPSSRRPAVFPAALLAFAFAVAFGATRADAALFNPKTATLPNGLEIVVIENHRVPVVKHMVWYKVGRADEPQAVSGIAHFLEHLMFKGTKAHGPGEFSRIVKSVGGVDNAFTTQDYTGYFQNVAADKLGLVMQLEADRMANLSLDAKEVESERDVILEERRMRVDNEPGSLLSEQANAATWLAYPYRIPTIGWENEMRKLSRQDALAFYRTWYAPNNAILVVAGDTTLEEVMKLARDTYGKIPSRPVPDRVKARGVEPPQIAARRVVLESARVNQPSWSRRYLAPSRVYGATELALPLEVLAEILGGGATSRLYRRLVVETPVAVSAGAWYDADGLGPQVFGVSASPRQGVTMEALEAAVEAEIRRVVDEGVTDGEVADAIGRMKRAAVLARDDMLAPARLFGATLAQGGKISDIEDWPDDVAKVTREQIAAAAKDVLVDRQSTTAVLLAKPAS